MLKRVSYQIWYKRGKNYSNSVESIHGIYYLLFFYVSINFPTDNPSAGNKNTLKNSAY